MGNEKVWDNNLGKMVDATESKSEMVKISIPRQLADVLEAYAKEDGFDFSGITYETEKDKDGKTKKNKDGKPIFVLENGKPKKIGIVRSQAKVNSALSKYVEVGVKYLIGIRNNKQKQQ